MNRGRAHFKDKLATYLAKKHKLDNDMISRKLAAKLAAKVENKKFYDRREDLRPC